MSLRDDAMIVAGGVVLAVLAAWYVKSKVKDAVDAASDAAGQAIDWTMHKVEQVAPYANPNGPTAAEYASSSVVGMAMVGNEYLKKKVEEAIDWTRYQAGKIF